MKFLTHYSKMTQTPMFKNLWCSLHNQLFKDKDGSIYLVPRYFLSDGYTIPNWLAWLGGNKMEWDTRPALGHDFECKYHQCIKVRLSEQELRQKGFLRHHTKLIGDEELVIPVCDDIPVEYLKVEDVTFNQANSRFKRMMQATGNLKTWRINLMRFAVNFNIGWLKSGKEKIDLAKLYKETI